MKCFSAGFKYRLLAQLPVVSEIEHFLGCCRKNRLLQAQVQTSAPGADISSEMISKINNPHIIATVGDAHDIKFESNSFELIYMRNVIHYIDYPFKAFSEIYRCLKPGGKIVMIEPTNTLFSRLFFKYVHQEEFDSTKDEWVVDGEGRLADANIAMPWIIFIRDREKFLKKYPDLKILKIHKHTPFRMFLSGGLSYKQFVPSASFGFFTNIEKLLLPFNDTTGSFMTIVVKKIE